METIGKRVKIGCKILLLWWERRKKKMNMVGFSERTSEGSKCVFYLNFNL